MRAVLGAAEATAVIKDACRVCSRLQQCFKAGLKRRGKWPLKWAVLVEGGTGCLRQGL